MVLRMEQTVGRQQFNGRSLPNLPSFRDFCLGYFATEREYMEEQLATCDDLS
jgi:hypothetical protein